MKPLNLNIPKTATLYISQTLTNIYPHEHYSVGEQKRFDGVMGFKGMIIREDDYPFVFVRNPFDWLASYYAYMQQKPGTTDDLLGEIPFREFLKRILLRKGIWPGCQFLYWQMFGDRGEFIPRYVGRTETIDDDLTNIAGITGQQYYKKPANNKSPYKLPYQEYYDEETYKAVEDAYRRELDLFGYDRNGITKGIFDYPHGEKTELLYIFCDDAVIVNGIRLKYKNAEIRCYHKWKIEKYRDEYDSNKQLTEKVDRVRCLICGKLSTIDGIESGPQ